MRTLFFFLMLCGLLIGSRYWYVCKIKLRCNEVQTEDSRPKTLSLTDGDRVILDNFDQFAFEPNEVNPKLNANNSQFLDQIATYLQSNPEKELKISGHYRNNEEGIQTGIYDNLGIARAAKVREALVARGISEDRISLDYNQLPGDDLIEPVTFHILQSPDEYSNEQKLSTMQFSFFDMTYTDANFDFDSDAFMPGDAFKLYADSVKTYLELNPTRSLTIIGHTDHHGTDQYNEDLGLRRAKSAREYFRSLGLQAPINVGSKGEKEPVAKNDTRENRQKNRRVNLKIE